MAPRALVACLLLAGCFPPGEGVAPPLDRIYFPVGLAFDEPREFLFVVNSDYDLQYNAGTVLSLDLAQIRARLPRYCDSDAECESGEFCDLAASPENSGAPSHWCVAGEGRFARRPCGAFGQLGDEQQVLYPGRCGAVNLKAPEDGGPAILADSVEIGAFATDVVHRTRPVDSRTPSGAPGRLFIPVRGDATLHWIDVESGRLQCGQAGNDGACDALHRAGDDPREENTRYVRLLPEPFGLDADEAGRTLVVSNQTSGAVGLFTHDWSSRGPLYQFTLGGLPSRPIGVAALPATRAVTARGLAELPGFLVSYRDSASVTLVRAYGDEGADPARPYLRTWGSAPIRTNSSGVDSRGLAVDGSLRAIEEQRCAERFAVPEACARGVEDCAEREDPGYVECVTSAAAVPLEVFVANRAPASLVFGRSRPVVGDAASDLPQFGDTMPLSIGPSRVVVGEITTEGGERERRVFVICFDSRRIVIYDPERRRVEAEVLTGRGPHALAIDAEHAVAYVAHFTDSYLGVIDLDRRHTRSFARMIGSFGEPSPPRSSK